MESGVKIKGRDVTIKLKKGKPVSGRVKSNGKNHVVMTDGTKVDKLLVVDWEFND